jgi:mutator protein MutT
MVLMKVAMLWLVNEEGEILLARRAANMDSNAGLWGPSVSGKVEPTETVDAAVVRETEEELGIKPNTYTPHFMVKLSYADGIFGRLDFFIYFSRVKSAVLDKLRLEPDEVSEVKWVSLRDLRNLLKSQPETVIISDAKELWHTLLQELDAISVNGIKQTEELL